MKPDAARARARRLMARRGETITLRRVNPAPAAPTDVQIRARVMGYAPQELVGGINEGDRKIIALAEDIEASGFPLPIRQGSTDRVIVRNSNMLITLVDDSTRRIGSTLIEYEFKATGK